MANQTETSMLARQRVVTASRATHAENGHADGALAWSSVEHCLREAQLYWIGTTRPNGRPHAVLIWGVWINDLFVFEERPTSRRARNLAANPAIAVHCEHAGLGVSVEGYAESVSLSPADQHTIAALYVAKYRYLPAAGAAWWRVLPDVAFVWNDQPDHATRFHFSPVSTKAELPNALLTQL